MTLWPEHANHRLTMTRGPRGLWAHPTRLRRCAMGSEQICIHDLRVERRLPGEALKRRLGAVLRRLGRRAGVGVLVGDFRYAEVEDFDNRRAFAPWTSSGGSQKAHGKLLPHNTSAIESLLAQDWPLAPRKRRVNTRK